MAKETNTNFIQLIISLSMSCMQQLGKITNPLTGKVERNLEQAKYSIELLRMLQEKTEGNLSDEERTALENAVYESQMNYIDEVKKGDTAKPDEVKTEDKEKDNSKDMEDKETA